MKRFLWVCFFLMQTTLLGCGYRWGFTKPEGVRAIALETFGNETFRRGVEIDLTKAVSNEIVERTGLILASPKNADAILQGKITLIQDQIMLEGGNGIARFSALWIDVEAELKDSRTNKVIARTKIRDKGTYLSDNNQDRTTATSQAVTRLAEKLVLTLCSEPEKKKPKKEQEELDS